MNHAEVLVIGGGAAGLMCAITAAGRGRSVTVLEGSNRVGKKILMSCDPSRFISHNPHFCKSALSRYTQHDFIALVEKHEIPYHEKKAGQLFCDRSSKDIVNMLLSECDEAGVNIETHCAISEVTGDGGFHAATDKGRYSAESLVIATGGLSIPKMGATGFGYDVARLFGLSVFETRAGLVPVTFTGRLNEMTTRLSGVSCAAGVKIGEQRFVDDLLFTHRGLSGPAILQASSYWHPGDTLEIDLLPSLDAAAALLASKAQQPRSPVKSALAGHLPRKLVGELQDLMWPGLADTALGEIGNDDLAALGAGLNAWRIRPAATEGYRTAEVTLGGVDTNELSSKTMESKRQPGLFFIGEVVDVTGHLGGFNFQWAWSSGYAAGLVV